MKRIVVALLFALMLPAPARADLQAGIFAQHGGNYQLALQELEPLADQGMVEAQYFLGEAYQSCWGVTGDYAKAASWYHKAAIKRYGPAEIALADLYKTGSGVEKDTTRSERLYRLGIEDTKLLVEHGDPIGQFILARIYARRGSADEDPAKALNLYRKAAEQGLAISQYFIAKLYHSYRESDDYEKRFDIAQNYSEAAKWYRQAAEQGFSSAQVSLGYLYQNGNGVTMDHLEAVKWYRMAAEQGDSDGEYVLGTMYCRGLGVPKSATEALRRYSSAAKRNYISAWLLGSNYEFSGFDYSCVKKNIPEAIRWYGVAAELSRGYVGSEDLAKMYAEARGVAHDDVRAYAWARIAAQSISPDEDVAELLEMLEKRMTPTMIEEGERLAREWLENHGKC